MNDEEYVSTGRGKKNFGILSLLFIMLGSVEGFIASIVGLCALPYEHLTSIYCYYLILYIVYLVATFLTFGASVTSFVGIFKKDTENAKMNFGLIALGIMNLAFLSIAITCLAYKFAPSEMIYFATPVLVMSIIVTVFLVVAILVPSYKVEVLKKVFAALAAFLGAIVTIIVACSVKFKGVGPGQTICNFCLPCVAIGTFGTILYFFLPDEDFCTAPKRKFEDTDLLEETPIDDEIKETTEI